LAASTLGQLFCLAGTFRATSGDRLLKLFDGCEDVPRGEQVRTQLPKSKKQQQPNERDDYDVLQFSVAVERRRL
jgi:hypothetical protein